MKTSLREKLEGISLKYHEIEKQLADPNIYSDQKKFKDLSVEFSKVENIVKQFNQYNKIEKNIEESKELLGSDDNDIKDMAENEIKNLKENLDELLKGLELSLLPEDPNDENNLCYGQENGYVEIDNATGGTPYSSDATLSNPIPNTAGDGYYELMIYDADLIRTLGVHGLSYFVVRSVIDLIDSRDDVQQS